MAASVPGVKEEDLNYILSLFRRILDKGTRVYIYGSRFRGDNKLYSDLDISLDENHKINSSKINVIEDTLADSNIAYKVDLCDFQSLDESFQEHIQKHSVCIIL